MNNYLFSRGRLDLAINLNLDSYGPYSYAINLRMQRLHEINISDLLSRNGDYDRLWYQSRAHRSFFVTMAIYSNTKDAPALSGSYDYFCHWSSILLSVRMCAPCTLYIIS